MSVPSPETVPWQKATETFLYHSFALNVEEVMWVRACRNVSRHPDVYSLPSVVVVFGPLGAACQLKSPGTQGLC